MRTPRSNFVVEYKTNRRHAEARPKSIWGNLDLRAVARAVEADGSVPEVDLPQVPSVVEDIATVESIVVASNAQVDVDRSPDTPTAMPSPEKYVEPIAVEDNPLDGGPCVQEQPASAATRTLKSRATTRAKTPRSQMKRGPVLLEHRSDSFVQHGSEKELAALEAENRHLKRLMIMKLREENDRLKSMLRRFGST
ncbi:hypothetical protein [Rhizobium bangladeshense]|uniref:hypothetical protein n=1 Tax=Rhizobium bangladeshense TaxID=1138189 RepID=UPI001C832277|nr:hypothetical protein [Rhizobium bangladeshense]MBX4898864.1 hypothetical protein [Rhizobium bangladeshense]MBY3616960.1 hypothetical protein [Rhizobium bangladeshense]